MVPRPIAAATPKARVSLANPRAGRSALSLSAEHRNTALRTTRAVELVAVIRRQRNVDMVICGTRGDRVRGPGTTLYRRDRRGGGHRRHQLGQGVGRGCSSRRDDSEYRAARVISGGGVIVAITGVEPHFVAAAGARHRYNGTIRSPAAVSWVADHLLRSRESVEAGCRRSSRSRRGRTNPKVLGEARRGEYGCAFVVGACRCGRHIEDRIAADEQIPVWPVG